MCTRKKSQQIYASEYAHPAGLDLAKLTYTSLEDNLIRHRGDRFPYQVLSKPLNYFSNVFSRVYTFVPLRNGFYSFRAQTD